MRIPTEAEVLALHERHAPTPQALDLVYSHCQIVAAVAGQLLARSGFGADGALVRAGCLLHDIGVYRLYDEDGQVDYAGYIRHGVLGYELLAEEGYPEAVCRFASHHTGVGLTAADVLTQRLPLPPGDYRAGTPEETVVMYADKFHSKTEPPVFLTAAAYAASLRQFGPDKEAAFAVMRAALGEPDLAPLVSVWGHQVIDVP
jgi:uncharacterized protein